MPAVVVTRRKGQTEIAEIYGPYLTLNRAQNAVRAIEEEFPNRNAIAHQLIDLDGARVADVTPDYSGTSAETGPFRYQETKMKKDGE